MHDGTQVTQTVHAHILKTRKCASREQCCEFPLPKIRFVVRIGGGWAAALKKQRIVRPGSCQNIKKVENYDFSGPLVFRHAALRQFLSCQGDCELIHVARQYHPPSSQLKGQCKVAPCCSDLTASQAERCPSVCHQIGLPFQCFGCLWNFGP